VQLSGDDSRQPQPYGRLLCCAAASPARRFPRPARIVSLF
jgi:hypothetical protein